jgi:hypothetical protein
MNTTSFSGISYATALKAPAPVPQPVTRVQIKEKSVDERLAELRQKSSTLDRWDISESESDDDEDEEEIVNVYKAPVRIMKPSPFGNPDDDEDW